MKFNPRKIQCTLAVWLTCGGLGSVAFAQRFTPPTGLWEVQISGAKRLGTAYIDFDGVGGLTGTQVTSPVIPASVPPASGSSTTRPGGGQTGRGGTGNSATNQPTTSMSDTNSFGGSGLVGTWTFDADGRVIGFLNEVFDRVSGSGNNVTNIPTTNGMSFTAVVRAGRSLALTAISPKGRMLYRGVPHNPGAVTNLGGSYSAWVTRNDMRNPASQHLELFTLIPTTNGAYSVLGIAPAIQSFTGHLLTTRSKQVSLLTRQRNSNDVVVALTAVSGRFNYSAGTATLTGVGFIADAVPQDAKVTYRIRRLPTPPAE